MRVPELDFAFYSSLQTTEGQAAPLPARELTAEEKFAELARKHPELKLDGDFDACSKLLQLLEHQKKFVVKNGNVHVGGILIKGAPALPTFSKFTPNFRDQNQGLKPQSRGLTHGKVVQIATQALLGKREWEGKPSMPTSSRSRTASRGKSKSLEKHLCLQGTQKTPHSKERLRGSGKEGQLARTAASRNHAGLQPPRTAGAAAPLAPLMDRVEMNVNIKSN